MIYDHANIKGILWIDIQENFDLINSPESRLVHNISMFIDSVDSVD